MTSSPELFLHDNDGRLQVSPPVEQAVREAVAAGERVPNDPASRIAAYLGRLAAQDVLYMAGPEADDADALALEREQRLRGYAIALTPDNADKFLAFQLRVARDEGRGGDLKPEAISASERMRLLRFVHEDQVAQLQTWVAELNDPANAYPMWFKYWVLQSVTRLTAYNPEVGTDGKPRGFEKRSASSFALFPELDQESLSRTYDAMVEKFGGPVMGFGEDTDRLRSELPNPNFARLYAAAQAGGFRITEAMRAIRDGRWHDHTQSVDKDDARKLSGMVARYRTGWCTAGLETAHAQLQGGDFYIWCSTDPRTGEDTVPRIAIRMENGQVAEVRGIDGGRRQELEPGLLDIAMERVRQLPGGDAYAHKEADRRRFSQIDRVLRDDAHATLTREDIAFLYEVGGDIEYFGYERDPRINELRQLRGEQDVPVLCELIAERVEQQLEAAIDGYVSMYDRAGLAGQGVTEDELRAIFKQQSERWLADGAYEYLAGQPIRYSLAAVPPVFTVDQLIALAKRYSNASALPVEDDSITGLRQYPMAPNAAAGTPHFILVPDKRNLPRSGNNGVTEMRAELEHMAEAYPNVRFHVPTPTEVFAYFYAARERGGWPDSAPTRDGSVRFNLFDQVIQAEVPPGSDTPGIPPITHFASVLYIWRSISGEISTRLVPAAHSLSASNAVIS